MPQTLPYHLKSLPWDIVEKAITEEIKWLKATIQPLKEKDNACEDCIYRRLAVLIVSGRIKAREIKSTISLWGEEKSLSIGKPHGKEWHTDMMKLIGSYFNSLKYDVTIEPKLNTGRADLGIYKKGKPHLFIEVGTISLSKLLFNLESMEKSIFLLSLEPHHAVEFYILMAGYKYYSI